MQSHESWKSKLASRMQRGDLLLTRPTHLHRQIINIPHRRIEIERRVVGPAPRIVSHIVAARRRKVALVSNVGGEDAKGIRRLGAAGDGHFDGAVGHDEVEETLSGALPGRGGHDVVGGVLDVGEGEGGEGGGGGGCEAEEREDGEEEGGSGLHCCGGYGSSRTACSSDMGVNQGAVQQYLCENVSSSSPQLTLCERWRW
jgi:hypothetical protein